jgi:hypothetical protein
MYKYRTLTFAMLCCLLATASCDSPDCANHNPVFDQFSPDEKAYKDELVKQLTSIDSSALTYWMHAYQEINSIPSIHVRIKGDGICAIMVLNVQNSNQGIAQLLEKKGVSYIGAELEDLRFDIRQDSASTAFVFQSVSGIVD